MNTVPLPPNVSNATRRLADALNRADPIETYRDAQARFLADPQATALLDQLAAAQSDLRVRQSDGTVTQEDIDRARALQSQVQANSIIMTYIEAQQAADAYLVEVNLTISQLLGIDFASLARTCGC